MRFKLSLLVLLISTLGFSQNKGTITGLLSDKESNNQPLPFANAVIKGTTIGTATDETGKYTFTVAPGVYIIQFSFKYGYFI